MSTSLLLIRRVFSTTVFGGTAVLGYRYKQVMDRQKELLRSSEQQPPLLTLTSANNINNINKQEKKEKKPPVIVIGAGVVGVCTAYKLAKLGYDSVYVLEPRQMPGQECTKCAAGGMQRANVVVDIDSWKSVMLCLQQQIWNNICFWRNTTNTNNDQNNNYQNNNYQFFHMDWLQTITDPFFLRWIYTFTKTSFFPNEQQERKQNEMLKFTKYAVDDMVENFMEEKKRRYWDNNNNNNTSKASGYNKLGSLSLSYEENATEAKSHSTAKLSYEPSTSIIGTESIINKEPSIRFQTIQPTVAKYEPESKSASSQRFTEELAKRCCDDLGVQFFYNTTVQGIVLEEGKGDDDVRKRRTISKLLTNRGVITLLPDDDNNDDDKQQQQQQKDDGVVPQVVVAAGAWTPHLLAKIDLFCPVYPLKGYALSVDANTTNLPESDLPQRIVSDKYMYTSRLGTEIRITSIGEFSGWSTKPTPSVDVAFRNQAKIQFPQLATYIDDATTYCGHRPFVSDGILLLGNTSDTVSNLWVSCGPGSNGWKLAMGSGDILARLLSGQTATQIEKELGFDVSGFSPANNGGRVQHAPIFAKLCRAWWNV